MLRYWFVLLLLSVVASANPSIFKVENPESTYSGTAFQIQSRQGPIMITNRHVCTGEGENHEHILMAIMPQGGKRIIVIKKIYSKHDLCILSGLSGVPTLSLGKTYFYGQHVTVDGYPFGEHAVTDGKVGEYIPANGDTLQQTAVIYWGLTEPGNSGSPVLDDFGQVIGVIAVGSPIGTMGGFVPIEFLKDFMEENNY